MTNVRISQISTLAECNEFQYLLMGDLQDLLGETQDETNRKWLLAILDVMVQLMPRERHLHDEAGGYLSEVLDEFPGWSRQVLKLHLKKLQLDYLLRDFRDRIRRESSWVAIADQLVCEIRDWTKLFTQLHKAESKLMMEVLLTDIGTGD